MGFSEWVFIALLAGNLVLGAVRGWKASLLRLTIMLVSLGGALALSGAFKNWIGFQLSSYVALPQAAGTWLTNLIPFSGSVNLSAALSTIFFLDKVSMLIVIPLFLIFNVFGRLVFKLIHWFMKLENNVDIRTGRKNIFGTSLNSIIIGGILGLLQGFLITGLVYAPISEIVLELVKIV